jgi:hypothetical protein
MKKMLVVMMLPRMKERVGKAMPPAYAASFAHVLTQGKLASGDERNRFCLQSSRVDSCRLPALETGPSHPAAQNFLCRSLLSTTAVGAIFDTSA